MHFRQRGMVTVLRYYSGTAVYRQRLFGTVADQPSDSSCETKRGFEVQCVKFGLGSTTHK